MPRKIDPLNLDEQDAALLDSILKQQHGSRISKKEIFKIPRWRDSIELAHSLLKIGNSFFVIDEQIGEGSDSKVKLLPRKFEQNSKGIFTAVKSDELVVKRINMSDERTELLFRTYNKEYKELLTKQPQLKKQDFVFKKMVEEAQREIEMLRQAGDEKAQLIVDDENHKVYICCSKAPGVSLDNYLQQKLDVEMKFHLIRLIDKEVQKLKEKGISHLDLKPENIFYDKKTDKITIIDFGSSQYSTASLASIPDHLHATSAMYNPVCHQQNKPDQIDAYSLAGIYGQILDPNVMRNKNNENDQELNLASYAETFSPENTFPYDFDVLLRNPDLVANLGPDLGNFVSELKKLGEENFAHRSSTQEFSEALHGLSIMETDRIMTSPISQLNATELEALRTVLKDFNKFTKSEKAAVEDLVNLLLNNGKPFKNDEAIVTKLNKIMQESIEKQKSTTKFGLKMFGHPGGSNVLRAIVDLDERIKRYLDPELLREAQKYSMNIFERKFEEVKTHKVSMSKSGP